MVTDFVGNEIGIGDSVITSYLDGHMRAALVIDAAPANNGLEIKFLSMPNESGYVPGEDTLLIKKAV